MVHRGNPSGRVTVGRTWRALQDQVYASTDICWLCGRQVHMELRHTNPTHPLAPSVDHRIPKSLAPELALNPSNLTLAHYGCNSARGNRMTTVSAAPMPRSRNW